MEDLETLENLEVLEILDTKKEALNSASFLIFTSD